MTKQTLGNIVFVAATVTAIGAAAWFLTGAVRSRFAVDDIGDTIVFFDKYLPRERRDLFLKRYESDLGTIAGTLDIAIDRVARREAVIFATKSDYGVLSSGDPLVVRRLKGRPSGDFRFFSEMAKEFFANEAAADSCVSDDGYYIFINLDRDWEPSLVHATVHSLATRSMPRGVANVAKPSGSEYDARMAGVRRFTEESVALFMGDLMSAYGGRVDGSTFDLADFRSKTDRFYAPDGPIRTREEVRAAVTATTVERSYEYFLACRDFSLDLVGRYGFDRFKVYARKVVMGEYRTLADLGMPFGTKLDDLLRPWAQRLGF